MKTFDDQIDMMSLLGKIAPLERTQASKGTDDAFAIIKQILPGGKMEGYPTGKKVWGWKIPPRFEVKHATIRADGQTLVDEKDHHLHLLNYSRPFRGTVSHSELMKHLYSNPELPDAIPFTFRFYEETWGTCIPHSWRPRFKHKEYEIDIDESLESGSLSVYYDFLLGQNKETFIICSNICHPTQVNDSLTSVAVGADIIARLGQLKSRKYSYLF